MTENGYSPVAAKNLLAHQTQRGKGTIKKIIKEYQLFGEVIDGSGPRDRLTTFEKLSVQQRDAIRRTVSAKHSEAMLLKF